MLGIIYTVLSVSFTLFMSIIAKKHLYVYQHESSIKKELDTFENNLETLKKMDLSNNYVIGPNHIY
jgi:hypothetical protein